MARATQVRHSGVCDLAAIASSRGRYGGPRRSEARGSCRSETSREAAGGGEAETASCDKAQKPEPSAGPSFRGQPDATDLDAKLVETDLRSEKYQPNDHKREDCQGRTGHKHVSYGRSPFGLSCFPRALDDLVGLFRHHGAILFTFGKNECASAFVPSKQKLKLYGAVSHRELWPSSRVVPQ
jgi:hypothetical protein